ncbi:unnamed protein product [Victoria cruziana]
MALSRPLPWYRLPASSSLDLLLGKPKPFSTSSLSEEEGDDDYEEAVSLALQPATPRPRCPLVDRFYSVIQDHYRRTLSLCLNPSSPSSSSTHIPNLSPELSLIAPRSVSPSTVAHTIQRSAQLRHGVPWRQTLAFFNWASDHPGFAADADGAAIAYREAVGLLGKVHQFDHAWSLIGAMKARGIPVDANVFLVLVRRYARAGLPAEAVHTFNRMEDYGCVPDSFVFASVIGVLAKKRFAEEAQSFFDGLKHRFRPDVVIYSALIHGWCRVHRIGEAERVFREMKEIGVQPNVYTYSCVIDGLCRSGRIDRGYDLFREMVEVGCAPNAATFNSLMRAHVKADQTEQALQVHNQMKRLSCEPDAITHNYLIEAHCRAGNFDNAMKALNQMVAKGCPPNASSFNPLFQSVFKAKDVNGAHRLFSKMKDVGCKPNTVTYNILMRMFSESRSTDMVMKMKKDMDENSCEPNVNTYRILISMFCSMGHWNRAYKFFREMIEDKCLKPALPVYSMVLEQLRKAGQVDKHEELVEKMVARGFVSRPL